jgi:hypothetical protein
MKPSASRARERSQQPDRLKAEPVRAPRRRRSTNARRELSSDVPEQRRDARVDERALSSNLPDQIPVSSEEAELVRIYFGDLIRAVLKEAS